MIDLMKDLQERWQPSAEQIAAADAKLAEVGLEERHPTRERGVYTAHVLVGKEYGVWTEDVEILPIEGVFLDREMAAFFARKKAQSIWSLTGVKTVGGYTWHPRPGEWSVWEDILARFPLAKGA